MGFSRLSLEFHFVPRAHFRHASHDFGYNVRARARACLTRKRSLLPRARAPCSEDLSGRIRDLVKKYSMISRERYDCTLRGETLLPSMAWREVLHARVGNYSANVQFVIRGKRVLLAESLLCSHAGYHEIVSFRIIVR